MTNEERRKAAEWFRNRAKNCPMQGARRMYELATEALSNPKWIIIESRPMTEEERKEWSEHIGYDIEYEHAIIYTSKLPDDGQEVLVCNKYGSVWIDTFDNDPDYGVGFETNGDMDGIVAWMPTPKPYKPPKESES